MTYGGSVRIALDVADGTLYERLTDQAERAELERALSWVMMTPVRVAQMSQDGLAWKRGNGNGRALLTEAQVEAGQTCSLRGG